MEVFTLYRVSYISQTGFSVFLEFDSLEHAMTRFEKAYLDKMDFIRVESIEVPKDNPLTKHPIVKYIMGVH